MNIYIHLCTECTVSDNHLPGNRVESIGNERLLSAINSEVGRCHSLVEQGKVTIAVILKIPQDEDEDGWSCHEEQWTNRISSPEEACIRGQVSTSPVPCCCLLLHGGGELSSSSFRCLSISTFVVLIGESFLARGSS
jgi:hypothetical protein